MPLEPIGKYENKEAEQAVLSLLIINHSQTKIHIPDIHDDYFFTESYRKIFKTIKLLTENGETVDVITIKKKTETEVLTDVVSCTSSISNLKSYIKILKDHADRRWFIQSCNRATETKAETQQIMGKLSTDIINRLRDRDREKTDMRSITKEFEKYQADNKKHIESGNEFIGMPSGFPVIDRAINGIRAGHYWIVNAYNNIGKSYFLLNVANRLLDIDKRILYFSLEMSRVQNYARLLGLKTKIEPTLIERGDNINKEELEAKANLYEKDLVLYTQKRSINDIVVTVYAEHSIKPIDCIMIDYIQKIQSDKQETRYERYTHSSDMLQKISQELQIPVLVASQIDNQSARSRSTDIISTKGSGDIANDVDFALLLQKSEDNLDTIDCYIQKNRHGSKGGCQIKFYDGGNMYETNN